MFDPSYLKKEVRDFSGAWLLPEETDIPSQGALLSVNCRFAPGQVATRYGHSSVFNPSNVVTSMFNWIFADATVGAKNILVWYSSDYGGIRTADLSAPGTGTDLYTQAAYGAVMANAGPRVYISHFASTGLGVGHGRVNGFGVGVDNLFSRPMLTTEVTLTPTEPGAGSVTQGTRRIGFIITTRNGYTGKFAPVNTSLVFQPTTFTNAGAKNMNVQVTPATVWPTFSGTIQLIASTTANLSRMYFVPNTAASVPAGAAFAVNLLMDISDDDLTTIGTEVTSFNNLLTQDSSNNAPFSPIGCYEFGNRMTYIVNSSSFGQCAFHSTPNNYQAISADQNIRYLPGQKQIVGGFAIRDVFYYLGPFWTYSDQDNGDIPANWGSPTLVDGAHGTLSPRGWDMNVTQGFAWIACRDGLYRFAGGAYDARPATYYQQPDWDRINWATAAHTVVVRDDPTRKLVTVLAPLDGASAPTHELTLDYTGGTDPESVKYSINNKAAYNASAMCIVQNQTTRKQETWYGPGVAGPFVRANDGTEAHPYRDVAQPIDCQYRTADFPGENAQRYQVHHHHGAEFRITGAGTAAMSISGLDGVASVAMNDVPLSATPGKETINATDLINESARYLITNKNALDSAFQLSLVRHFYSPYGSQR